MVVRSRRTIALDLSLIDVVKEVARRRGMTLSSYLRRLLTEAIELEKRGIHAPRVLREKRVENILTSLNFILIPMSVLEDPKRAYSIGYKIGRTLKSLNINLLEVIEYLGERAQILMYEGKKYIITPPVNSAQEALRELIKGIASGGDLKVRDEEEITIIYIA